MVSVQMFDESNKYRDTTTAETMGAAIRSAINTGQQALGFGQCERVYIRDALGGLRVEIYRDSDGKIATRHTK